MKRQLTVRSGMVINGSLADFDKINAEDKKILITALSYRAAEAAAAQMGLEVEFPTRHIDDQKLAELKQRY